MEDIQSVEKLQRHSLSLTSDFFFPLLPSLNWGVTLYFPFSMFSSTFVRIAFLTTSSNTTGSGFFFMGGCS